MSRSEDEIIAWTWRTYLDMPEGSRDQSVILRAPMTKVLYMHKYICFYIFIKSYPRNSFTWLSDKNTLLGPTIISLHSDSSFTPRNHNTSTTYFINLCLGSHELMSVLMFAGYRLTRLYGLRGVVWCVRPVHSPVNYIMQRLRILTISLCLVDPFPPLHSIFLGRAHQTILARRSFLRSDVSERAHIRGRKY